MDAAALADLLREAEEYHGHYEPVAPKHHWYDWYAPVHCREAAGPKPGRGVSRRLGRPARGTRMTSAPGPIHAVARSTRP
jgi:hypothetical protein